MADFLSRAAIAVFTEDTSAEISPAATSSATLKMKAPRDGNRRALRFTFDRAPLEGASQ
ncbi:hypothetical protein [Bradyrhizobium sp. 1200_D9_N1_1]|uniref:hypothetical protein n=1 Tax=Bradyrhizobium sp. 1200_D9_N1_1 TaxID=3239013 RepID=UPI003F8C9CFC